MRVTAQSGIDFSVAWLFEDPITQDKIDKFFSLDDQTLLDGLQSQDAAIKQQYGQHLHKIYSWMAKNKKYYKLENGNNALSQIILLKQTNTALFIRLVYHSFKVFENSPKSSWINNYKKDITPIVFLTVYAARQWSVFPEIPLDHFFHIVASYSRSTDEPDLAKNLKTVGMLLEWSVNIRRINQTIKTAFLHCINSYSANFFNWLRKNCPNFFESVKYDIPLGIKDVKYDEDVTALFQVCQQMPESTADQEAVIGAYEKIKIALAEFIKPLKTIECYYERQQKICDKLAKLNQVQAYFERHIESQRGMYSDAFNAYKIMITAYGSDASPSAPPEDLPPSYTPKPEVDIDYQLKHKLMAKEYDSTFLRKVGIDSLDNEVEKALVSAMHDTAENTDIAKIYHVLIELHFFKEQAAKKADNEPLSNLFMAIEYAALATNYIQRRALSSTDNLNDCYPEPLYLQYRHRINIKALNSGAVRLSRFCFLTCDLSKVIGPENTELTPWQFFKNCQFSVDDLLTILECNEIPTNNIFFALLYLCKKKAKLSDQHVARVVQIALRVDAPIFTDDTYKRYLYNLLEPVLKKSRCSLSKHIDIHLLLIGLCFIYLNILYDKYMPGSGRVSQIHNTELRHFIDTSPCYQLLKINRELMVRILLKCNVYSDYMPWLRFLYEMPHLFKLDLVKLRQYQKILGQLEYNDRPNSQLLSQCIHDNRTWNYVVAFRRTIDSLLGDALIAEDTYWTTFSDSSRSFFTRTHIGYLVLADRQKFSSISKKSLLDEIYGYRMLAIHRRIDNENDRQHFKELIKILYLQAIQEQTTLSRLDLLCDTVRSKTSNQYKAAFEEHFVEQLKPQLTDSTIVKMHLQGFFGELGKSSVEIFLDEKTSENLHPLQGTDRFTVKPLAVFDPKKSANIQKFLKGEPNFNNLSHLLESLEATHEALRAEVTEQQFHIVIESALAVDLSYFEAYIFHGFFSYFYRKSLSVSDKYFEDYDNYTLPFLRKHLQNPDLAVLRLKDLCGRITFAPFVEFIEMALQEYWSCYAVQFSLLYLSLPHHLFPDRLEKFLQNIEHLRMEHKQRYRERTANSYEDVSCIISANIAPFETINDYLYAKCKDIIERTMTHNAISFQNIVDLSSITTKTRSKMGYQILSRMYLDCEFNMLQMTLLQPPTDQSVTDKQSQMLFDFQEKLLSAQIGAEIQVEMIQLLLSLVQLLREQQTHDFTTQKILQLQCLISMTFVQLPLESRSTLNEVKRVYNSFFTSLGGGRQSETVNDAVVLDSAGKSP